MKNLKWIVSFCLIGICVFSSVGQAKTVTLDKTKVLVPQGWSTVNSDLKFKKGTTVELNSNGEVVSGTLNRDIALRPTGWRNMVNDYYEESNNSIFYPRIFHPFTSVSIPTPTYGHVRYKGDRPITFAADGTVLSGTIDEEVTVSVQKDRYGLVTFNDQYELAFYPDGSVRKGRLNDDTMLRPNGWQTGLTGDELAGFVEFKKGSDVTFSQQGYVTSGVLKKDVSWQLPNGEIIMLKAGQLIYFTDNSPAME